MDPDLSARLAALEAKIDATYASVEKLRKYFFWTGVITVLMFVIPLLVLPFVLPLFLQSLSLPAGL